MSQGSNWRTPQFDSVGPVTFRLCVALVGASVLFTLTERSVAFGIKDLIFTIPAILDLEVWRLLTYPFLEADFFGLLMSVVIVYLFGRHFEAQWGGHAFFRFFMVSSVGGAILAIPIHFLIAPVVPFHEVGVAMGPGAAIDAMLVALALSMPDSNILLGFVLPMPARKTIYVVLGIEVVMGIMSGSAALSVTLGGMAMGYLMVTGNWRPGRWLGRWRIARLQKSRRGLHVVPPQKDRTLH
jgi:membrane associated rhomboid family serine protease